jgi:hypothetical protein
VEKESNEIFIIMMENRRNFHAIHGNFHQPLNDLCFVALNPPTQNVVGWSVILGTNSNGCKVQKPTTNISIVLVYKKLSYFKKSQVF